MSDAQLTVYTVGHSNQSADDFVALLRRHAIEVLVDVRSAPYSRYVPHFNGPALAETLREHDVRYLYLGKELGGRPATRDLYDDDGRARYDLIAATDEFREGIERLLGGAADYRVAIMCSEEDPAECHRRLLVGRVLVERGAAVEHIRGDGRLERQEAAERPEARQQSLWGHDEGGATTEWKSIRSVLPRSLRDSSSAS